MSQGEQQPVNKLSDQLREVVAHAGFTEALTFALVRFALVILETLYFTLAILERVVFRASDSCEAVSILERLCVLDCAILGVK